MYALVSNHLLVFSLRINESDSRISDYHSKRKIKKTHSSDLYSFFLLSIIFPPSAFNHSSSTSIVVGHNLKVTTRIQVVFRLQYLNDVFLYQRSLP